MSIERDRINAMWAERLAVTFRLVREWKEKHGVNNGSRQPRRKTTKEVSGNAETRVQRPTRKRHVPNCVY